MELMLNAMSSSSTPWNLFEEQVNIARQNFAKLIGAEPEQVAVMPNASVGAYQVASSIDWSKRPKIIASSLEFPSIAHVWQAQRTRGAQLLFTEEDQVEAFEKCIDETTGLVSVPMASYCESRRLPVEEIAAIAAAKGAKVFIDAYQSAGVEPIRVKDLRCDYLVAGTTKYLLGLPGVAFIYFRDPDKADCLPSLTGWFGRVDPFAFDSRKLDFADCSRKYETGTPSVPALYAANAGLGLILDLDMDKVRSHISALVNHASDRLIAQGEQLRGAQNPANRGTHIAVVDDDPLKLQAHLAKKNITVSPRGNVARLSFHYYNRIEDADAVCDEIAAYRQIQRNLKAATTNALAIVLPDPDIGYASDVACKGLDRWLENPKAATFPFSMVTDAYHRNGKEFVDQSLLGKLDGIRRGFSNIAGEESGWRLIDDFLWVALDKHDRRYDYPSYCALKLLPMPTSSQWKNSLRNPARDRDRQLTQLMASLLSFELLALQGRSTYLPGIVPNKSKMLKRIRLGLNAAKSSVNRLGLDIDPHASDIANEAKRFCNAIQDDQSDAEKLRMQLTMLPVFTVHDEHLFIRILQSFETNFAWIAVKLKSAINAFGTSPEGVADIIAEADVLYHEAARLFPLLATMQRDAFQTFREYTDGASAIQSRNYKRVESLCRSPCKDRRDSLAYRSVPDIRDGLISGQSSIDAEFHALTSSDRVSDATLAAISAAMEKFSATLQSWRQTHYRLAVKMLGDQRGSGQTEGAPYLSSVREVPVFLSINAGE